MRWRLWFALPISKGKTVKYCTAVETDDEDQCRHIKKTSKTTTWSKQWHRWLKQHRTKHNDAPVNTLSCSYNRTKRTYTWMNKKAKRWNFEAERPREKNKCVENSIWLSSMIEVLLNEMKSNDKIFEMSIRERGKKMKEKEKEKREWAFISFCCFRQSLSPVVEPCSIRLLFLL